MICLEDYEHRCGLVLAEAESFGGGGAALAQGARRLARSLRAFELGGADECDHNGPKELWVTDNKKGADNPCP